MLMNKATIVILPCKDKGSESRILDQNLDKLSQPKSNKRRHNDAAHFVPFVFKAWGHEDDRDGNHTSI
jgi:hypothetical protein